MNGAAAILASQTKPGVLTVNTCVAVNGRQLSSASPIRNSPCCLIVTVSAGVAEGVRTYSKYRVTGRGRTSLTKVDVPTGVCAKATSRPLAASVAWRQRSAPAPIVGCSPRTRHITTFRARPMRACGSSMKQSNPDIRTTGSAAVAAHGACLASPTAVAVTANPVSRHPIPIARIPASPTSTQPHSSVVLNGNSGEGSNRQGTRNPGRCAMPCAASRAGIAYRTSQPPSVTSWTAYSVPHGTLGFQQGLAVPLRGDL